MIDLAKPNVRKKNNKKTGLRQNDGEWTNMCTLPPICETRNAKQQLIQCSSYIILSIKQFKMVGASILSDWVAYTSRISWRNIQKTPSRQTSKRQRSRGVWGMSIVQFWTKMVSSGCGGHIHYFFIPEALAIPQKCFESRVTSHYPWFLQQCHCLSSSFEKSPIIREQNIKAPENRFLKWKLSVVSQKIEILWIWMKNR